MVQLEFLGIGEVNGGNIADSAAGDFLRQDLHAQPNAGEDHQLGPGIETIDIFGWIGLGVSALLRFAQGGIKLGPVFHVAENEIAGAVQNAVEAVDAVAGQALLHGGNDWNAARHRRAVK